MDIRFIPTTGLPAAGFDASPLEGTGRMAHDEASRRELIEFWLAANDGEASKQDLMRLNAALAEDEEFREDLLQIIEHQAWLSKSKSTAGRLK